MLLRVRPKRAIEEAAKTKTVIVNSRRLWVSALPTIGESKNKKAGHQAPTFFPSLPREVILQIGMRKTTMMNPIPTLQRGSSKRWSPKRR
jgi:hypothetical protein